MKRYSITVNGNKYEVEVEEIGGAAAPVSVSAPAKPAAPAAVQAPTALAPSSGSMSVKSPMPGAILGVLKKPGDAVAEGEAVIILEAMKMENEIAAPKTGVIDTIAVTKGMSVNTGDLIFSVK